MDSKLMGSCSKTSRKATNTWQGVSSWGPVTWPLAKPERIVRHKRGMSNSLKLRLAKRMLTDRNRPWN